MGNLNQNRIIVSVTNDLVADNRVHKVCTTLSKAGYDVLLIGRKLPQSPPPGQRNYKTIRLKMIFNKGPFFYAEYNFRLFLFLLLKKSGILLSNDLDTLPANYYASRLKKLPLVYDSHEYFTEVPELINRPRIKKIWEILERKMVPKVTSAYTVCESIAKIYKEKYGTHFHVVRNVPFQRTFEISNKPGIQNKKMILYQGAINVGRGLEQAIRAMKFVEHAELVIAGNGDIKTKLEQLVAEENLQNKVRFAGRLPLEELAKLTPKADLGLSIEEDLGLNYRFTLPNKLFDYIQAQVPVLVSNLPEMAAVVKNYGIGKICNSLKPEDLAKAIHSALFNLDERKKWNKKLKIAAEELNWENEEKILTAIFSKLA